MSRRRWVWPAPFAALLCAPLAVAGEAPAEEPAPQERKAFVEEIVVTGTRVRRKDLTTPAPVAVISREQVAQSGRVSLGDLLQSLPEQGNALNAQHNFTGDGSTRVSLRSLGDIRTLILVNGRRLVAGGSNIRGTVDLNSIPASAIERIEILKDGASAVYGSDAIAGVVNVITRRGWTGSEVHAHAGASSRGDGAAYDLSASTGLSSERGSLGVSVGYFDQRPVWAGNRAWTAKIHGYNYRTRSRIFSGSTATPAGTFDLDTAACGPSPTPACQALIDAGYTGANSAPYFIADPSQPGRARVYGPGDAYNFEPDNYLYTPARRLSLFTAGEATLGGGSRAFLEGSYVNRRSEQRLAPAVVFTLLNGLTVSSQSYYNPYGVDLYDVRRRMTELGPRISREDIDTFRAVVGLDGTLPGAAGPLGGWFWEASLNYGRASGTTSTQGDMRAPLLQNAVGPSFLDPADGVVKCGTPGQVPATCVPLDLLGRPGTISAEQATALGYYGIDRVVNQLAAVQVNASGDLFRLLSERPVGLALGYEWRRGSGESRPNPITQAGEGTNSDSRAAAGSYHVQEAYAELSFPIASGFALVDDLEASLAGRFFRYSSFGSDSTYKAGLRWRPVRSLAVRGTWSTAFRAPSIEELYLGTEWGAVSAGDPCAAPAPGSRVDQLCQSQGVAAGGNRDSMTQQVEHLGGNPGLRPETARIYTAGLVLEPTFLRGLTVTVDRWDIELKNTIDVIGAGIILSSCYTDVPGASRYCDLVHRSSPATGAKILFIDDRNANVGSTRTAGFDLSARYDLRTALGRFRLRLDGTYVERYDRTEPSGRVIHYRGHYDGMLTNGSSMPAVKLNAAVTWGRAGLGAGVSTRYVSSMRECASSSGVSDGAAICSDDTIDPVTGTHLFHTIAPWISWDAFVSYAMATSLGKTAIALGINNVFDGSPPVIYNNGTYQSDPSTYDFMGRYVYARLTHTY